MMVTEYRGFLAELLAEENGEPVYPVWNDLPNDPQPLLPKVDHTWMRGSR